MEHQNSDRRRPPSPSHSKAARVRREYVFMSCTSGIGCIAMPLFAIFFWFAPDEPKFVYITMAVIGFIMSIAIIGLILLTKDHAIAEAEAEDQRRSAKAREH